MGFSLAEEAAKRGAKVILISGPSSQKTNIKILKCIK
jgi:phosphopantothenoylcysteine decarboxylase/phosphopantothenate--cysteine ligase